MKPELLVPAGSTESFYAAIEAGADAIYLGLDKFNARKRAKNFSVAQLPSLTRIAHKNNTKIYVTLNTLIKNEELSKAIDLIYAINQTQIDALIIQDWGVFYILNKYFPQLPFHASTQMGFHNSLDAAYAKKQAFERIILARELTLNEVNQISNNSNIELEIFVHGALCYSYSGHCLFSSFLGGMSANRGQCRQPCRRKYNTQTKPSYLFSLKDLQLIDHVPKFSKMGISSLKIEGRMKTPEYVYQVTKAYRLAIDDHKKIPEAKKLLETDLGREKTMYFMGQNVKQAISDSTFSGLKIGQISDVSDNYFGFVTNYKLEFNDRLRIMPKSGEDSTAIKVKKMLVKINDRFVETKNAKAGQTIRILTELPGLATGNKIFLSGFSGNKFNKKLPMNKKRINLTMPARQKDAVIQHVTKSKTKKGKPELYIRINDLKWLKKMFFNRFDGLILNFSSKEWRAITFKESFLRANINKLIVELPLFIPEDDISFYRQRCFEFVKHGIKNFMISHLSQTSLIPPEKRVKIWTNEHVYILNDAAAKLMDKEKIYNYIYPQENDIDNLFRAGHKRGIVPLYYHPQLFYSRMPIGINDDEVFSDNSEKYGKYNKNGFTIVYPQRPVSVLQYKNKLFAKGYHKFLIDLTEVKASQNTFNRLLKKFENSDSERETSGFNYKKGLW